MSSRRSLRDRVGWGFAAALLLLYGTGAALGWSRARWTSRLYAELTLKSEVEAVAAYLRTTGRLDAPELAREEREPLRLWLRVVRDGAVLVAAPETPPLPPLVPRSPEEVFSVVFLSGARPYVAARHVVGPSLPGTVVEGIGDLRPMRARERRLALSLALAGLVVIPLAALGGRLLAGRALAPLDGLVAELGRLGPTRPGERLSTPPATVAEIAVLAGAFNDLLARLEESLATMRRFTADASHEIRNPLSVLQTGIEIALRRERAPEEYRTLLRENLQEIERLRAVVEGLLALTRAEPGRPYPLSREPVDLAALVEEGLRRFELVAADRGVALAQQVEPGTVVDGDPALLALIVFNLVDNALKHGPDGGVVRVALAAGAGVARLTVADSGPGIPDAARPFLFDRFFRGPGERGGLGGLGLGVVRWVARLHGGEVALVETAAGAAFAVELPLAPPADPAGGSPAGS